MDKEKIVELCHSEEIVVRKEDLAVNVGSGDLEVFATPALIALMEKTCLNSIKNMLDEGMSSVGISISCEHLKASGEGAKIKSISCVKEVTDKIISFSVEAYEGDVLIGKASHERAIIEVERFLKRIKKQD